MEEIDEAQAVREFIHRHGGYWSKGHSEFCRESWLSEVNDDDTRQGYWEWAYNRSNEASNG